MVDKKFFEGIWAGIPSVFVRISGCNLRCAWCDTPYASWSPEGPTLTITEILGQVSAFSTKHVVVTGGEPMLFDAVEPLIIALNERGHVITVETAGTIYRDLPIDLISISPKLANSTPEDPAWAERHESTRLQPVILRDLIAEYEYQLKFVIQPERSEDLAEIDGLLAEIGPVEPNRVLLMPEGIDSGTLWARAKQLVPICMERGWRLCPRLHIDLFGNSKGT